MVENVESAFVSRDALSWPTTLEPDGRIRLPTNLVARADWQVWKKIGDAWLLLVSEGRYRLLSDEQARIDPRLQSIYALITGEKDVGTEPTPPGKVEDAAMFVRLLPIRISTRGPVWRISLPKAFHLYEPSGCQQDFVVVLLPGGFWELWYTEILRKGAFAPLPAE